MQFLKNIVAIIALFTVALTNAKGVTTSAAQSQPSSAKATAGRPIIQPQPQPTPRMQPQPMPQFETGPTYSEILSSLKKKNPDSSDLSNLNNIKTEVERQINIIAKSVTPQPTEKDMEAYAQQLVNKYYESFKIDQQRINNAIKNGTDIFPEDLAQKQTDNIITIVREFAQKYPNADKSTATQIIWSAIFDVPSLQTLGKQLSEHQDRYIRIKHHIQKAVQIAWDYYYAQAL